MKTLKSELIRHGFRPSGREIERKSIKVRGKCSERLTAWELADLMGTNRPTYRRGKGGAFRQR